MASCLFNIYLFCLLYHAFQENTLGAYLHTHFDGGLFNVQRLQARTTVSNTTVTGLLFSDAATLVAQTSEDLQTLLDRFATACTAFGIETSEKKTVVICSIVFSLLATDEPKIEVNGKKLAIVEPFCYLGS